MRSALGCDGTGVWRSDQRDGGLSSWTQDGACPPRRRPGNCRVDADTGRSLFSRPTRSLRATAFRGGWGVVGYLGAVQTQFAESLTPLRSVPERATGGPCLSESRAPAPPGPQPPRSTRGPPPRWRRRQARARLRTRTRGTEASGLQSACRATSRPARPDAEAGAQRAAPPVLTSPARGSQRPFPAATPTSRLPSAPHTIVPPQTPHHRAPVSADPREAGRQDAPGPHPAARASACPGARPPRSPRSSPSSRPPARTPLGRGGRRARRR